MKQEDTRSSLIGEGSSIGLKSSGNVAKRYIYHVNWNLFNYNVQYFTFLVLQDRKYYKLMRKISEHILKKFHIWEILVEVVSDGIFLK